MSVTHVDWGLGALTLAVWLAMAYIGAYGAWRGYDVTAHALAGYAIGTGASGVTLVLAGGGLVGAVVAALVVSTVASVVWEAFEFAEGINPWHGSFKLGRAWDDTSGDMFAVAFGALLAAVVVAHHGPIL